MLFKFSQSGIVCFVARMHPYVLPPEDYVKTLNRMLPVIGVLCSWSHLTRVVPLPQEPVSVELLWSRVINHVTFTCA